MDKILKKIHQLNEYIKASDNAEHDFYYNSINDFIDNGITLFTRQALIFDELKDLNYNIQEIIASLYSIEIMPHIIEYDSKKDEDSFKKMLDIFYLRNLSIIEAYRQDKNASTIGSFFCDYIYAALLAYCYYPNRLDDILHALRFCYKHTFTKPFCFKHYGYNSVFQLLRFVVGSQYEYIFEEMKSVEMLPVYEYAINNILSEDVLMVNDVLNQLAKYHNTCPMNSYLDLHNHIEWRYLPLELFAFFKYRQYHHVSNDGIKNKLTNRFFPHFMMTVSLPETSLVKKIEDRLSSL